MNSSDETPLPLFERFRDAHITNLIGLMDDVMTSMGDLDRSLETAVAISKEFTYLQSIWGALTNSNSQHNLTNQTQAPQVFISKGE
ncbi:uncharacterized protein OGAPODRAFT_93988 [Ogataea polymorpha]|uniref:uncharacterized protein n=1 Tax=Ogataea polymorpha TaxID=460523 RepID=UPI0007F37B95|nr:uncharacterized protein OGAPODRAFT_93988 [Ogataea polymorpha]OBA15532.1 hypothetical protein OGAPODRAFT_93988 [Ogataea polymorpha]